MSSPNNKTAVPAWQRATSLPGLDKSTTPEEQKPEEQKLADEATDSEEQTGGQTEEQSTTVTKPESLVEQATRFLQDPSIQNAPRERKIAFLESKGLKREDMEVLLPRDNERRRTEAVTPTVAPQPVQPARDVPPVITYPEFLVHASKPPPLVTTSLLFNTAYVTAGLYATIYGLSKYIINPMETSLNDSRHDFLSHATEQLETLNSKLSTMVSTVPPSRPTTSSGKPGKPGDLPDNASDITTDSDPTELFHRDFGTQTSPSLSRRGSLSEDSFPITPTDILSGQENRLKIMSSHLKDLEASSSSNVEKEDVVTKQLSALTSYLNDMAYSSPYYRYGASSYGDWGNTDSSSSGARKDDEIEKLKTEIRSVKGVLLSTRNFPRGGPGS